MVSVIGNSVASSGVERTPSGLLFLKEALVVRLVEAFRKPWDPVAAQLVRWGPRLQPADGWLQINSDGKRQINRFPGWDAYRPRRTFRDRWSMLFAKRIDENDGGENLPGIHHQVKDAPNEAAEQSALNIQPVEKSAAAAAFTKNLVGITGATGAVGSQLVHALLLLNIPDLKIRVLVRNAERLSGIDMRHRQIVEPIFGDLLNVNALRKLVEENDIVLHLAGWAFVQRPEGQNPREADISILAANALSAALIARLAKNHSRRLVITSTDFVYALDTRPIHQGPVDENIQVANDVREWLTFAVPAFDSFANDLLKGKAAKSSQEFIARFLDQHPLPEAAQKDKIYALSKLLGEHLVAVAGVNAVILRPSSVYGPGDIKQARMADRILKFFSDLKDGLPSHDPNLKRDTLGRAVGYEVPNDMVYATYVGDLVHLLLRAAVVPRLEGTEIVTVSGPGIERGHLYNIGQTVVGGDLEIQPIAPGATARQYVLNRMAEVLQSGTGTMTSHEEGMRQAHQWYQSRKASTSVGMDKQRGGSHNEASQSYRHLNIGIVGAGFYGATLAWFLAKLGHVVTLYEKERDIMLAASGNNTGRLHLGFHYPRSDETARQVHREAKDFLEIHSGSLLWETQSYYSIARHNSHISVSDYQNFLHRNGLPELPLVGVDDSILNKTLIEGTFQSIEPHIDLDRLRLESRRLLDLYDVNLVLGHQIQAADARQNHDFVVYAGYANLNDVLPSEYQRPLRYDIVELLVLTLPEALRHVSLVVLDGPFVALGPWSGTGHHLLTHVVHSSPYRQVGLRPEIPEKYQELVGKGFIPNPPITQKGVIMEEALRFFPILKEAVIKGSIFVVRTLPAGQEGDDARLSEMRRVSEMEFAVLGGKLGSAPAIAKKVADAIHQIAGFGSAPISAQPTTPRQFHQQDIEAAMRAAFFPLHLPEGERNQKAKRRGISLERIEEGVKEVFDLLSFGSDAWVLEIGPSGYALSIAAALLGAKSLVIQPSEEARIKDIGRDLAGVSEEEAISRGIIPPRFMDVLAKSQEVYGPLPIQHSEARAGRPVADAAIQKAIAHQGFFTHILMTDVIVLSPPGLMGSIDLVIDALQIIQLFDFIARSIDRRGGKIYLSTALNTSLHPEIKPVEDLLFQEFEARLLRAGLEIVSWRVVATPASEGAKRGRLYFVRSAA